MHADVHGIRQKGGISLFYICLSTRRCIQKGGRAPSSCPSPFLPPSSLTRDDALRSPLLPPSCRL